MYNPKGIQTLNFVKSALARPLDYRHICFGPFIFVGVVLGHIFPASGFMVMSFRFYGLPQQ